MFEQFAQVLTLPDLSQFCFVFSGHYELAVFILNRQAHQRFLRNDSALYKCSLTIAACIDNINNWMSSNRLKLNTDKTQFTWLGTAAQLVKINSQTIILVDADIQISDVITWLRVVIDSQLTFIDNVKKLSGSCFYHLWQLHSVRHSLTTSPANTLVHALISSCVDYCNIIPYGVCEIDLRQLLSVLNTATQLITGKRKFAHISSTMRDDLHWLPVGQCIQFMLCTLVSKCLRLDPQLGTLCRRPSATCQNHLFCHQLKTELFGGA